MANCCCSAIGLGRLSSGSWVGTEGKRIKSWVRMMVGDLGVMGAFERSGERRGGLDERRFGLCNSRVAMLCVLSMLSRWMRSKEIRGAPE